MSKFKVGDKVQMPGVPLIVEVLEIGACEESHCHFGDGETFRFKDGPGDDWMHAAEFEKVSTPLTKTKGHMHMTSQPFGQDHFTVHVDIKEVRFVPKKEHVNGRLQDTGQMERVIMDSTAVTARGTTMAEAITRAIDILRTIGGGSAADL